MAPFPTTSPDVSLAACKEKICKRKLPAKRKQGAPLGILPTVCTQVKGILGKILLRQCIYDHWNKNQIGTEKF